MILAEKLDQRRELAERLREWLLELIRDAAGGGVRVSMTADGWMRVEAEDEVLVRTIIGLQTRINPIISDKPPFPLRIYRLEEDLIKAERPSLQGKTIRKSFPIKSFAASLGYDGKDPRAFLEAVGITEGAIMSISADLPSFTQLALTREQVLRGLDRLLVLNAAPQEVEAILAKQGVDELVAESQALTLSTHLIYVRLGISLEKAYERLRREFELISDKIKIHPMPWNELAGQASLTIAEPYDLELATPYHGQL